MIPDKIVKILKVLVKQNQYLYYVFYKINNIKDNVHIIFENSVYRHLSKSRNIYQGENTDNVFKQLNKKLGSRGITWPPQKRHGGYHILYVSIPTDWELHNIPPDISSLGRISNFYLKDHIQLNTNLSDVRKEVDGKIINYISNLHKNDSIDFIISYLSGSHISKHTIEVINQLGIPTFSFHLDDVRFFKGYKTGDQYSGPIDICKKYDLNLTNSIDSLIKYRALGANALFWPPGANPHYFKPLQTSFKYDVTFCGQFYGQRQLLINYLRKRGISVNCFGKGWEGGYKTNDELVQIFSESRINLGFGYVVSSSFQCLKGRDFEIPSCGALYLTSYNKHLSRVYTLGEDIETYTDFSDCYKKIVILLNDEKRCEEIRKNARNAVLKRHSWSKRVESLISCSAV
ncbi:MAG: glycosyltransferase [Bacteroidota bacterium]